MTTRTALIVRGGWEGHQPVQATEVFLPFLERSGYDDPDRGVARGLRRRRRDGRDRPDRAVRDDVDDHRRAGERACAPPSRRAPGSPAGTAGSPTRIRASSDYLQLVGGQFATHPSKEPGPAGRRCAGEQLPPATRWRSRPRATASDHRGPRRLRARPPSSTGCCTTTSSTCWPPPPIRRSRGTRGTGRSPRPPMWTRLWGARPDRRDDTRAQPATCCEHPSVRTIIERGMLWATRTASAS